MASSPKVSKSPMKTYPRGPRGPRREAVPRIGVPRGGNVYGDPPRWERFCYDCQHCVVKLGKVYKPLKGDNLPVEFVTGEAFLSDRQYTAFTQRLRNAPPAYCRMRQWDGEECRTYENLMNRGGMHFTARSCRFYDYMDKNEKRYPRA